MTYSHLEKVRCYEDLHHECEKYIELRERDKGTGTAYGHQCQFCGAFKGGEISKRKVSQKPAWYDSKLEVAYQNKLSNIHNALSNTESVAIKKISDHCSELDDVINNFFEGTNLDKQSVFRAYLTRQREKYIANEFKSEWQNENQLHTWLIDNFSEHFEIHKEVKGIGFINRQKREIKIDFILKAKPILIEHGFTNQYIGVEVKYFSPMSGKGFHGKSSKGVFQALSYWYSGARWFIPNLGEVELASILIFSNLSFKDESDLLFNTLDAHYRKVWRAYLSIANHANVGELNVRTYGGKLSCWAMEYDGTKYYSMNSRGRYITGNKNVINKLRIGNF